MSDQQPPAEEPTTPNGAGGGSVSSESTGQTAPSGPGTEPPSAPPAPPAPPAAGSPAPPVWPPHSAPPAPGGYPAPPAPGSYPPPAPPVYGQPYPPAGYPVYPPPPPTSTSAIIGLVLAIGSWFLCPVILAIVALVLARSSTAEIEESAGRVGGAGLNTATRIISWINIGLYALIIVGFAVFFLLAAFLSAASSTN